MQEFQEGRFRSLVRTVSWRILLTSCACLSLSATVRAEQSVVERHGQLRVEGNRIVDKHGKPVALHGMSLFWSQWIGKYYNADAVKHLRDDWGCTVVRAAMAVEAGGYLRNPEREKQKVQAVVQAAIDLGIYVIVDWHDHNAHRHTKEAQAFFAELAQTYGKHPNIIYETWNEPLNKHDWSTVIKPYHEAVIPKIREHDPDGLIVCGTQTWSQDVDKAARDPLKFENVAYVLHFYAATHKQRLRDKAEAALKSGAALIVAEWGTSEANGSGKLDYEETQKWLEFMDKNQLSWCNWSLADKRETSAALNPGADAKGGWTAESLSPSGALVREEIRKRNASVSLQPVPNRTADDSVTAAPLGKVAPKPLFRDPVYDGAADPALCWNRDEKKWFMLYTNRRANAPNTPGVSWVHGTRIGIAESADGGATWKYKGVARIPVGEGDYSHWAPEVLYHDGVYHMYLTFVPGMHADWSGTRDIMHLTGKDLTDWKRESTLKLSSNRVIDACVLQLPDGAWRMWYNNEVDRKSIYYADSPDLYNWKDRGKAIGDQPGEGPKVFHWKDRYWMVVDVWDGLGVYASDDLLKWTRQKNNLLTKPGKGADDGVKGQHPDVAVSGGRAFLFYFTHPGRRGAQARADGYEQRRSSIQVVELQHQNGELVCDRDRPTRVLLRPLGDAGKLSFPDPLIKHRADP